MEGKKNISQYRQRLDKTLASYDLANEENLKVLVKNQILRSSQSETEEYFENVVEKRTKEVSNFLKMLKSASMNDDGSSKTRESPRKSWKIKQDTEEYRVMYREGPEGTPFHTLLVEGYIDGPLDVCLCISWESVLYGKWWPQSTIPTFKIVSSECLQKIRIGEQISLVRMKVSWPLSAREALVHFFEFEYFKDGLIVVLLNSISDLENVDVSTHGFSRDGIPDAQEVVRIDVVGGFALQKVSADRSYFRTIATMDIKLDFVPPSFINFISRQLIGSGFKLYQKEVASVTRGDEDFGKALKDPLYARVREALYSDNKDKVALGPVDAKNDACTAPEEALYSDNKEKVALEPEDAKNDTCTAPAPEELSKSLQAEEGNMDKKGIVDVHATETLPEDAVVVDHKAITEIEEIVEEDMPESRQLEEDDSEEIQNPTTSEQKCCINNHKNVAISPQVKQALETLQRVISLIRENKFDSQSRSLPGFIHAECSDLRKSGVKDSKSSEDVQICSNGGVCVDATKSEAAERASHEPRNSCGSHCSRNTRSSSYSRETNHNRIAPASPEENIPYPSETQQTALSRLNDERTEDSTKVKTTFDTILIAGDKNVCSPEKKRKYRRWRSFCCLHSNSG